ncbi:hypothetical protein QOZ80_2AG0140570 [Eleusine coracana subsp. coracana]|nr:hypothetical protein QOZ80_2AG0140570 [Eleusine coracana subsp. coracana]
MSAALLALGVHWVATKSGHRFEPVVASGSVFLLGAAAAFARFTPTVALRFDYGVTAFILTYGYVSVSGYRVHELPHAHLWSGEQLHILTARNMESLAATVESCFAGPRTQAKSERQGKNMQCVLDSKPAEDAHANLVWWEPPHGRFGFRHPYAQYANVGAAMRRCACCLHVLGSCVSQSAERVLGEACTRLGEQSARVLREASGCIATMTVRRSLGLAVEDLDAAVHELRAGIIAVETDVMMPLFTVASSLLMIEVSTRVKEVVDAVHVLATLARFKPVDDEGGERRLHLG